MTPGTTVEAAGRARMAAVPALLERWRPIAKVPQGNRHAVLRHCEDRDVVKAVVPAIATPRVKGRAASSARCVPTPYPSVTFGTLRLIGPLSLRTSDGTDCTPGGVVRKALLAVLALSPGGTRARPMLQSLFWGASDPQRAAGSLRSALSSLRRELAPLGPILEIDGHSVVLQLDRLDIDVQRYRAGTGAGPPDPDGPDLLEGLDLAGPDREGFEDWLRIERSRWVDFLDAPTPAAPAGGLAPPDPAWRPPVRGGIGLLPVVAAQPGLIDVGDGLLDMIAVEARTLLSAEIYDYRDGERGRTPDAVATHATHTGVAFAGIGPDHLMQISLTASGDSVRLALRLCEAGTGRMAWTRTVTAPAPVPVDGPEIGGFLSLILEQLAATLSPMGGGDGAMPGTPYQTLNLMFSLAPDALVRADRLLDRAWTETGAPIHLGLMTYLDTFRVGESWSAGEAARNIAEATREGLDQGAFDGLYLTTSGYALAYLTDESELAGDLLTRAVELSPGMALAWRHLAMYHYFQGNYPQARAASDRAAIVGRFSPLRYCYDSAAALIAHATGDMASAVSAGRRALARQPGHSVALKVVTSALGLDGRIDEARETAVRIRAQDPTFTAHRRTAGTMRMKDATAVERMTAGLAAAGL